MNADRHGAVLVATTLLTTAAALLAGCGGGAEDTTTTTASTSEHRGALALPAGSLAVQAADVAYNFSAAKPESFRYPTLQCQGNNHYFWTWTGTQGQPVVPAPNPLLGTASDNTPFAAFSTVDSPGEPAAGGAAGKKAFRWELHKTDPDTAGAAAKRCEFSFGWKEYTYPGKALSKQMGLPANQDFWWAVAVRPGDTRMTSTKDSQILWQWHDAYGGGLPPFLSLIAAGGQLSLQIVHDPNTNPSNSTLKRVFPWTTSNWTPDTWMRFIVQARKDTVVPANSYVKVWLDGQQIVDYHGPFGYLVPQMDYAKVGIYHWISTANPWEDVAPVRVLHTKGPVQVNHRAGYTWQSINEVMD